MLTLRQKNIVLSSVIVYTQVGLFIVFFSVEVCEQQNFIRDKRRNLMLKREIKIAPSILSADFCRLGAEVKKCEELKVDLIHIDIMDGHFVPNISIGPVVVSALKKITPLPLDVHLMIENPSRYIGDFIRAGADIIDLHAECYGELRPSCRGEGQFPKEVEKIDLLRIREDLEKVKSSGVKVGVVLNPGTPLCLEEILGEIDLVLIMSVNPGFSEQKFIPSVLPKIRALRKIYPGEIKIDGGINASTAPGVVEAGANVLVSGGYFFAAANPGKVLQELKSLG